MHNPEYYTFPQFDNVATQIFNFLKIKHPQGQNIRVINDLLRAQHKLFPVQIPPMSVNYIHHFLWKMRERGFPIDYDTGSHKWGIRQSPHRFSVEIEGEITHTKLTLEQAEHYLYQAINQGAEDSHIIEEPLPNWPKP